MIPPTSSSSILTFPTTVAHLHREIDLNLHPSSFIQLALLNLRTGFTQEGIRQMEEIMAMKIRKEDEDIEMESQIQAKEVDEKEEREGARSAKSWLIAYDQIPNEKQTPIDILAGIRKEVLQGANTVTVLEQLEGVRGACFETGYDKEWKKLEQGIWKAYALCAVEQDEVLQAEDEQSSLVMQEILSLIEDCSIDEAIEKLEQRTYSDDKSTKLESLLMIAELYLSEHSSSPYHAIKPLMSALHLSEVYTFPLYKVIARLRLSKLYVALNQEAEARIILEQLQPDLKRIADQEMLQEASAIMKSIERAR